MSRISVRGIAVASATAVTTVGAVVGVSSGSEPTVPASQPVADATLLDTITTGQQATSQAASFIEQAQSQQAEAAAEAQQKAMEAARQKAAAEAAAKKAAKEAAAKAAAEKAKEAALNAVISITDYSVGDLQTLAQNIIGNTTQYGCFSWIVSHESGWNPTAENPSGAYGLVQALPGSKMAMFGSDWRTNPATQIKWGLYYMNHTYGSPCQAKQFWELNHWY